MKLYIYSTWKTGSSFTNKFFKNICNESRIPFLFLPEKCNIGMINKFKKKNNNYVIFPNRVPPDKYLKNERYLIQLRDPRDILVSAYFSVKYSHGYNLPESYYSDINKFILERSYIFVNRNKNLFDSLNYNSKYIFYEDMVCNFKFWANEIFDEFSINNNIRDKIINKFSKEFDSFPKENIHKHKRQMKPGDYKNKLSKETIFKINLILKDYIDFIDIVKNKNTNIIKYEENKDYLWLYKDYVLT